MIMVESKLRDAIVNLMEDFSKTYMIDSYEFLKNNLDRIESVTFHLDNVGNLIGKEGDVYYIYMMVFKMVNGKEYNLKYYTDSEVTYVTYMKYYFNHLILNKFITGYTPLKFKVINEFYENLYYSEKFDLENNIVLRNIGGIEYNKTLLDDSSKKYIVKNAIEYEVDHIMYIIREYIKDNKVELDLNKIKPDLDNFISNIINEIVDPANFISFSKEAYKFYLDINYEGNLYTDNIFIESGKDFKENTSSINGKQIYPGMTVTDFGTVISLSNIYEDPIEVFFDECDGKISISYKSIDLP